MGPTYLFIYLFKRTTTSSIHRYVHTEAILAEVTGSMTKNRYYGKGKERKGVYATMHLVTYLHTSTVQRTALQGSSMKLLGRWVHADKLYLFS